MFKMPEIKMTVLGSCGKQHTSFEEWQGCSECDRISAEHNQTGQKTVVQKQNEKEHNKIWNAAIEAAAVLTYNRGSRQCMSAAMEIRKLKK